jgi:hypothetical protein
MFRSQGEKISSVRIIKVLPANVPDNFIFFLPIRGAPSIQARDLCDLRKKEVTLPALNLLFMKTSSSH